MEGTPLPGGVASVARFLFQLPQWVQMFGGVVGVAVAVLAVVALWRSRRTILNWLATRTPSVKVALGATAVVLLLTGASAGAVSWNYMQHDNSFCTGCHVMDAAYQRFNSSEHSTLSCHDCHEQSIFASLRQLHLWVLERPQQIGEHAPVSNAVCETCHVTGAPEVWQHIVSTAGHRSHLESDSSALADVMCVTCHALEVHRFVPVDQTCAQAGCHVNQQISLGDMRNQTSLHCVTCHQFTADVPALATRDSAAGTLVPTLEQCLSCHEMRAMVSDFDPALDPHSGTCGMCHRPHVQPVAAQAATTCASAECHGDWRTEPFHVGPAHVDVGTQCTTCHEPHRSRVDASNCLDCHTRVIQQEGVPPAVRERLRRAMPLDTTRVIGQTTENSTSDGTEALALWGIHKFGRLAFGMAFGVSALSAIQQEALTAQPDTFSHDRHRDISCVTCHLTRTGHGQLTFEPPRGCQICHHQGATEDNDCATCHRMDASTIAGVTVAVTVGNRPTRSRPVNFPHDTHSSITCTVCHAVAVTMETSETAGTCTDCHGLHHAAGHSCSSCHATEEMKAPHAPPTEAHVRCDRCHDPDTISRLLPDRSFCLTCHQQQAQHHATNECSGCHMLALPQEFRRHLVSAALTDVNANAGQQIARPRAVQHSLEGRDQCLLCHAAGAMEPVPDVPETHTDRPIATCLWCHAPGSAMLTKDPTPIPHELEGRAQCLLCHAPGAMQPVPDTPADHEGRAEQFCGLCHKSAASP